MADTYENYFNSRVTQPSIFANNKFNDLQTASIEKSKQLADLALQRKAVEEINKESLVGKLGLDQDSLLAKNVNFAAATAKELLGGIGSIAATGAEAVGANPTESKAITDAFDISNNVVLNNDGTKQSGAFGRVNDAGISLLKGAISVPEAAVGIGSIITGGNAGKILEDIGFRPDEAKNFLDTFKTHEQQAANNSVGGAEGFWNTMQAIANNPSVIPHALLESLFPMLSGGIVAKGFGALAAAPKVAPLLGNVSKLAPAVGEGAVMAGSAAESIRNQSADDKLSFKQALAAATTGVMGGVVARASGGLANKLKIGDIDQAIANGTLGKAERGVVANVLGGSALEGGEELIQSAGETILSNAALDKELTQGVGNASAMGLVTGLAMGAPLIGAEQTRKATEKRITAKEEQAKLEAAIASGDISEYVKKSPDKAISILYGNSNLPDATPETRTKNLNEAKKVISGLENDLTSVEERLNAKELAKKDIEQFTEVLKTIPESDTAQIKEYTQAIEFAKEELAKPDLTEKELATITKEKERLTTLLEDSKTVFKNFTQDAVVKDTDITTEIANLKSTDSEVVKTAASKITILAMTVPEQVKPETALQLAEDTTNGLAEEQRKYLRAFSESRLAENATKNADGVSADIYEGSKPNAKQQFIGINQYRNTIQDAINTDNKKVADTELARLNNFALDRVARSAVISQAKMGEKIIKANGVWQIADSSISKAEAVASGGFIKESSNLVNKIAQEANAVDLAAKEMQAAYDLKFNPVKATSTINPVNVVEPASVASSGSVTEQNLTESTNLQQDSIDSEVKTEKTDSSTTVGKNTLSTESTTLSEIKNTKPESKDNTIAKKIAEGKVQTLIDRVNTSTDVNGLTDTLANLKTKVIPESTFWGATVQAGNSVETIKVGRNALGVAIVARLNQLKNSEVDTKKTETVQEALQAIETEDLANDKESGIQSLYARPSEPNAPFVKRNLLADGTVQDPGKEGSATYRPLVVVKNFMSKWLKDPTIIQQYLENSTLTAAQEVTLAFFKQTFKEWSPILKANVVPVENPDKRHEAVSQFLINPETKAFDENTEAAIIYIAHQFLVEEGNKAFNTNKDINGLLGRKESVPITPEDNLWFRERIRHENEFRNALGKRIVEVLGFKETELASKDLLPRLESELGGYAQKLLMDLRYIERKVVPATVMQLARGDLQKSAVNEEDLQELNTLGFESRQSNQDQNYVPEYQVGANFIRVVRNKQLELPPKVTAIIESATDSKGVLNKLFSTEKGLKYISLTPLPFTQKSPKGTKQAIPSLFKKALEEKQQQPHLLRLENWEVINNLPESIREAMFGIVEIDEATTQIGRQKSLEAANDALRREWKQFKEEIDNLPSLDVPMFLTHAVQNQQRTSISTNTVNPVTSKIVRAMIYAPDWVTTINVNNNAEMSNFKARVLEGFGVKTETQDGQTVTNPLFDEMFTDNGTDSKIDVEARMRNKAIDALAKSLKKESLNQEDLNALQATVLEGKENVATFTALMAMAQFRGAVDGKFETTLPASVDGVNNGPMLANFLYGIGNTLQDSFALLNMGGMFETGKLDSEGNQITFFNKWRGTAGNRDLYQTLALIINNLAGVTYRADKSLSPIFDAVMAFVPPLVDKKETREVTSAGRKFVKRAIAAIYFGSSTYKAALGMSEDFIDHIYDGIEAVAKADPEKQPAMRIKVVNSINTLLNSQRVQGIPSDISVPDLINFGFSRRELNAMQQAFMDSIGKSAIQGLNQQLGEFINKRDQLNEVATSIHAIYSKVYAAMRVDMINDLKSKGLLEVNSKGELLEDLNVKQEKELNNKLKKLFPTLHTPASRADDNRNAGIAMVDTESNLSTNSVYKSKLKFGKPMMTVAAVQTSKGKVQPKGITTTSNEQSIAPIGVGMISKGVHSLESFISHSTQLGKQVLNTHDSLTSGLNNIEEVATELNRHTYQTIVKYSPINEMYEALANLVSNLADMQGKGELSEGVLKSLDNLTLTKGSGKKAVTILGKNRSIANLLEDIKQLAYESDKAKLEIAGNMQSMNQFALENGAYSISDKEREEAINSISKLINEVPKATLENAEVLAKLMGQKTSKKVVQVEPINKITEPINNIHDERLVSELSYFPNMEGKSLLRKLYQTINSKYHETAYTAFQRELIIKLANVLPKDTKVIYITKANEASVQIQPNTHAWFDTTNSTVYILGTEYQNSSVTVETVLHELLHAALFNITDIAETKPRSKEGKLVVELNALLELSKQHVGTLSKQQQAKFKPMLTNVHELIAYGMSNEAFQDEVLSKVQMESSTLKNTLLTGLRVFIRTLTALFFEGKNYTDTANNGMAILIRNVTALTNSDIVEKSTKNEVLNITVAQQVDGFTTFEINDALNEQKHSALFNSQLENLLTGIVTKIFGTHGTVFKEAKTNQAPTPLDAWNKALQDGSVPFASKTLGSPLPVSEQEAFVMEQVEATVRSALEGATAHSSLTYSALSKLYQEAYKKLQGNPALSSDEFNFIFKLDKTKGDKSDHLARFAAIGLANEKVNGLLNQQADKTVKKDNKTIAEKIHSFFEQLLEYFNGIATKTPTGSTINNKLMSLVNNLVDIEAKKKATIAKQIEEGGILDWLDKNKDKGSDFIIDNVVKAAGSDFVRNNSQDLVRGAGAVIRTISAGKSDSFIDGYKKIYAKSLKNKQGLVGSLLNTELLGIQEKFQEVFRTKKRQEALRKEAIDTGSKNALKEFNNEGKNLTKEQSSSITTVVMKTGLYNLLDKFTMKEIGDLVSKEDVREKLITKLENELSDMSQKLYFIKQAKGLAHHKITGKVAFKYGQLFNAQTIAQESGQRKPSELSDAQQQKVVDVLNQLIPLYGITYAKTETKHSNHIEKVFEVENARTDGKNGIEFVMRTQAMLYNASKDNLFYKQELLMMHGFTSEILNPNTTLQFATEDEGKELEYQGYVQAMYLNKDPMDTDQTNLSMYILKDVGMSPLVSGAISNVGSASKGTKVHNGFFNVYSETGASNALIQNSITTRKLAGLSDVYTKDPQWDPRNEEYASNLAPILNADGEFANWRYLMQENHKDIYLDRDNSFNKVLGTMAGSIYDKSSSAELNVAGFTALKEQYDLEYVKEGKTAGYVLVGKNSTDPELKEIWNILPRDTKEDAMRIWGKEGIWMRRDLVDIMFGYRKYSLANIFDKEVPNAVEKLFIGMTDWLYENYAIYRLGKSPVDAENFAKRKRNDIAKGERIWQEVVREIKDTIVVKTGVVTIGNITSNLWLLKLHGVPVKDIMQSHYIAMRGVSDYRRDNDELTYLIGLRDSGYVQGRANEIARDILRLEDSLERNPVKKLIDAGLMPTIAEDVQESDDNYSRKSQLTKYIEDKANKLPNVVKQGAKQLYMAHDTSLYQGASYIAQMSDFVARYTLYQHLTTRKYDQLTHKEAIQEASDSFINYDIPMYRGLQYLDDTGLVLFTKYFLRIQRVISKLGREKSLNVLSLLALDSYMDVGSTVLDSSAFARGLYNPFSIGALGYPSSLSNLMTVNAPLALIK